jgi:hypothetical protein
MPRLGRPGLVGMAARTAVIAGTAQAVSGGVAHRQQQKWSAQDQAQYEAQQQPAQPAQPVAVAPSTSDTIGQLKELAALKEQGILTDEEFAAEKAKILGS